MAAPDETKRIIVLGSTGSIGTQTLEVLEHLNATRAGTYEVAGLVAGGCSDLLAAQAQRWNAPVATSRDGSVLGATRHDAGPDAACELIRREHEKSPIDMVVASIVGIAGLAPTITAIELGIDVALANKETLVAAGELVVPMAVRTGSRLLPVDSEHSALWQCMTGLSPEASLVPPMTHPRGVDRLTLTASGGALRDWDADRIATATPAQALAHPTWQMGPKVTIDTASLMNKGFEVMEARWLFGVEPDRIGVLIHPTSTVHSVVECDDGAMLAQLGTPDMRTAIQFAVLRGRHTTSPGGDRLDLARLGTLEFSEPDHDRFPMLGFAYDALRAGGTAGAILNAANEVVVAAFLDESNTDGSRLSFGRIAEIVAETMDAVPPVAASSLGAVMDADAQARAFARGLLSQSNNKTGPRGAARS